MISERIKNHQSTPYSLEFMLVSTKPQEQGQQEAIQGALALLLGPETLPSLQSRAIARLCKQGSTALPTILNTLNYYPEITTPSWPESPPQYKSCARLLLRLCRQTGLTLEDLLHYSSAHRPLGPVLWASCIEAAHLEKGQDHEVFFCLGLQAPWTSVRYASAMALADRSHQTQLQEATLDLLRWHMREDVALPVRLVASCTLLNQGDSSGIQSLVALLAPSFPSAIRKAALFILGLDIPLSLSVDEYQHLNAQFIELLYDADQEVALQAAQALAQLALPEAVIELSEMIREAQIPQKIVALTTIEILTHQKILRRTIIEHGLTTQIIPLLHHELREIRQLACHTLARCGGEYALAALGTIVSEPDHPARQEAIESLSLLPQALRSPIRKKIVGWLLWILGQEEEQTQITALDTIAALLWRARKRGKKQTWMALLQELQQPLMHLLSSANPWLRQRTLEILGLVDQHLIVQFGFQAPLLHLLLSDCDSGVRACAAYICGELKARWALSDLLHTLTDDDIDVVRTALHALARMTTPDDIILIYALKELIRYPHLQNPTLLQSAQETLQMLTRPKRK